MNIYNEKKIKCKRKGGRTVAIVTENPKKNYIEFIFSGDGD